MDDLSNILNDITTEEVETPPVEEVQPEQPEEIQVEPDPAPVEAEPEPDVTGEQEEVSTPETKEDMVPVAALMAERAKRQELESRMAQSEPADFYDDPEKALEAQRQENQSSIIDVKVDMSIELMKSSTEDFSSVVEDGTWAKLVQENPSLYEQAVKASNPAKYAYDACKKHKMFEEIGDPTTYKDRVRAELKAELEAEQKAQQSRDAIPDSMASVSSPRTKPPEWSGPESLEDIVS